MFHHTSDAVGIRNYEKKIQSFSTLYFSLNVKSSEMTKVIFSGA